MVQQPQFDFSSHHSSSGRNTPSSRAGSRLESGPAGRAASSCSNSSKELSSGLPSPAAFGFPSPGSAAASASGPAGFARPATAEAERRSTTAHQLQLRSPTASHDGANLQRALSARSLSSSAALSSTKTVMPHAVRRKDPDQLSNEVQHALSRFHSARIEKISSYDSWGSGSGAQAAYHVRVQAVEGEEDDPASLQRKVDAAKADTCSGLYRRDGVHCGKTKFTNEAGAIIYFDRTWYLNDRNDTSSCVFFCKTKTSMPPEGDWQSRDPERGSCRVRQSTFTIKELLEIVVDHKYKMSKDDEVLKDDDGNVKPTSLLEFCRNRGEMKHKRLECKVTGVGDEPDTFDVRLMPSGEIRESREVDLKVHDVPADKLRRGGAQMAEKYKGIMGKLVVRDYHAEDKPLPVLRDREKKARRPSAPRSKYDSPERRSPASWRNPELAELLAVPRPSLQGLVDKLDPLQDGSRAGNPRVAKKPEVPWWF
mmetsp:Transcript_90613/g.166344  ORF Transcript_90613/g.166344 Transcript_90613/m.166344 type:complete len:481 (+) Transcript_90613:3-1445(+)